MTILGISAFYHDSAAALLVDCDNLDQRFARGERPQMLGDVEATPARLAQQTRIGGIDRRRDGQHRQRDHASRRIEP